MDQSADKLSQGGLQAMRVEYKRGTLDESQVAADPIEQFARWFAEARESNVDEPNAMTLATVNAAGQPSARVVLLKDFDARGLTFYTNYESKKGQELAANPRAALVFFWAPLERQIRIEGIAARVSREESRAYFDVRPRASRIGAAASHQSRVISSRQAIETKMRELDETLGEAIPLPDEWGGYRLSPNAFEFWQGRRSRLHDRVLYSKTADGVWTISRLSP